LARTDTRKGKTAGLYRFKKEIRLAGLYRFKKEIRLKHYPENKQITSTIEMSKDINENIFMSLNLDT
jgi:hypothetical protein